MNIGNAFGWVNGLRYGAMGLPLAFVALPLYVLLPNHYAKAFGMPLATLGAVLLGARLFDAIIDPLIGRWIDALYARSTRAVLGAAAWSGVALCLGFTALFFPPIAISQSPQQLVFWAIAALVLTYTAYSVLSVAHQAWAARLGGDDAQRSRIVAWREGFGLVGVVLASVVPVAFGFDASVVVFCTAMALAWLLWQGAQKPAAGLALAETTSLATELLTPFRNPGFAPLFTVFVINGIASSVPATLLLFFVQDQLQAAPGTEGPLLAAYFVCAALSLGVWLRVIARLGLERAWALGMGLAIAVFMWAAWLGPGDVLAFYGVCALSGVALGADLAIPSALLAGVIAKDKANGKKAGVGQAGIYFGWWNFAAKLNLALAAGLALPLLSAFGYQPGSNSPQALQALTIAYCVLPCVLKALAGLVLWRLLIKTPPLLKPTP